MVERSRGPVFFRRRLFFAHDQLRADWQPGEIAKIGHFCVSDIPELRFDRLQLSENGRAIGIVRRDPVNGFEIRPVVSVFFGLVAVYRFLLSCRRQFGFFGAFFPFLIVSSKLV